MASLSADAALPLPKRPQQLRSGIFALVLLVALVFGLLWPSSSVHAGGPPVCGQFVKEGSRVLFVVHVDDDLYGFNDLQRARSISFVVMEWRATSLDWDSGKPMTPAVDGRMYEVGNLYVGSVVTIQPISTKLGSASLAMTGDKYVKLGQECPKRPLPKPAPVAKLRITDVQFDPSSVVAWQKSKVRITVVNEGERKLPQVWSYSGRLVLNKGTSYDFSDGEFPVVAHELGAQTWTITVLRVVVWDAGEKLSVETTITPADRTIPPASDSRSVAVMPNRNPVAGCVAVIGKGLCPAIGLEGAGASAVCLGVKTAADVTDSCTDIACAAPKVVESLLKVGFDAIKLLFQVKDTFQQPNARQVGECFAIGQWIDAITKELVRKGQALWSVSVHSPVIVLVTNSAGQRTGFLEDGSIVQEIPGAAAVQEGEAKYVWFPPDPQAKISYKGTGDGAFTLDLITADEANTGTEIVFENVPVASGASGQIVSSGDQRLLTVSGKQGERTVLPSKITKITAEGDIELPIPTVTPLATATFTVSPTAPPTATPLPPSATPTPVPSLAAPTPEPTATPVVRTLSTTLAELPMAAVGGVAVLLLALGGAFGVAVGRRKR